MKKIFKLFYCKSSLAIYKKAICLSLAFVLLFELSAQALLLPSDLVSEEVSAAIREDLESVAAPVMTPKEYLTDLSETLNKLVEGSDENNSGNGEETSVPSKMSEAQYKAKYRAALADQYLKYVNQIGEEAQRALEEFDRAAEEEIAIQTALIIKESNQAKKPVNDLFAEPSPFEASLPITSQMALANVKKDLKARADKEKEHKTDFKVNLTPNTPTTPTFDIKIDLNLDPELTSSKTYQEYKMKQDIKEIKQKQLDEKSERISQKIAELRAAIEKQRGLYQQEIADWQNQTFKMLDLEKNIQLNKDWMAYKEYSAEYDREEAAMKAQEIAFYKDLIHNTVENFKKTELGDIQAQKDFINIISILSSIKEKDLDRNKFIVGDDRTFIKKFLYEKFSGKNNSACSGSFVTTYVNNVEYGSCTALAGGGSVSAAKAFECQSNKKTEFKLSNSQACEFATAAMIPYANLDGDGYAFTNFIRNYWDAPMFGQILPVVVKSTLLTSYRGDEALSKFISDAISKENAARNSGGGFWETMNILTLEGASTHFLYDGKYCEHNLCSSADTGYNTPNAWEEVAHMLADANKGNILRKATDQCKITGTASNPNYLKCGGIYPLLFGALLYKPELANSLMPYKYFVDTPGMEYLDSSGTLHLVTESQARYNKTLNDRYDLLKKYGKAELMATYLVRQVYEDVHPANQMRMINAVASRGKLNPNGRFMAYTEDSDTYKKAERRYNAKLVVWALASYGDILIAIVATKDLIRIIGLGVLKVRNFVNFMRVLRNFRKIPVSFAKSVKIANALKAKGLGLDYIKKVNNLRKVAKAPIKAAKSAVIARLGGESQALIGSVSGRIVGAKNGVLIGTEEVFRPVSKGPRSTSTFRQTPLGGIYSTHANNLPEVVQKVAPKVSFWKSMKTFVLGLNPFIKVKGGTSISTEKLTLQIFDKKGKPVEIKNISVQDGILYVNDEMFKVFKATLPEDQLGIIADLVKQHKIALGIDGVYVKPTWQGFAPTFGQKFRSLDTYSELVNVYDETGKVIMQLGLDRALPQEAALLEKLGVANPYTPLYKKVGNWFRGLFKKEPKVSSKKPRKSPKKAKTNETRLVYVNDALYLEEGGVTLTRVDGLEGFSLPKKAVCNMTKGKQIGFLTDLFSMPSKTPTNTPLKFSMTRNKIWPVFFSNLLSYSAAGSGLLLTMEQKPFDMTSLASVTLGLFLPYITSFVAPVFAPLVSKWGARTFLNLSYGLAAGFLGLAWAKGYGGQATYQTDEKGRVKRLDAETTEQWLKDDTKKNLIDKEGKLYKTKDQLLPVWPLYAVSFFTGLASSGVRASSNVLLKGYEVKKKSMTFSMLFKNLGGLTFTLIPFVANRFASGFKIDRLGIDVKGNDKFVDFSAAYPVLFFGTLGMMAWIRLRMPKLATPGYQFNRADFRRPWQFLTNPKIYPYVGGMFLASSLEGYVLFKGTATFARERFQDPEWTPDNTKDDWADRENAKFFGAVATAFPQILLRGVSPRKMYFGRGLFNSALLATGGTLLLLTPSQQYDKWTNAGLGTLAGFMVGFGTANAFQYSQKLIMAQADLLTTIPNARRDAQILYSMSNLGLALPFFYGINADRRKKEYGEGEFDATRHSFHWPLMAYALGMGLILDAEINSTRVAQGFFKVSNNLLVKPTKYLIPAVMPAVRYGVEGTVLTNTVRSTLFETPKLQTPLNTPKLNINFNPMPLNNTLLPPTPNTNF